MPPRSRRIRFPGALGAELVGVLDTPPGRPRACALFAHCFTCSKDLKAARWISRALAERGYAVLRFDFTGLGESEGDFADTSFSSNLDDLVAAARFLETVHEPPRLLVGHSLGGAAVIAAAERIPSTRAVATVGAPSDTRHVLAGPLAGADPACAVQEVELAGRAFRIKRQLLDDLARDHLSDRLKTLRAALLVMHSPLDRIVAIGHAARIYTAAHHPKSFVSLDDADHLLTRERDARYAAEVLAAWASRYMDDDEASAGAEPRHSEEREGAVAVRSTGPGLTQEIRARDHRVPADEPLTVPGGADEGPTPYELLLGGLGACTSMTLRMYADRKQWPLVGVTVHLRHDRIHADDCEDCDSETGLIDKIDLELELEGDLDAAQRARLLEIAGRCPVNRTLTTETKIRKRLAESSEAQSP